MKDHIVITISRESGSGGHEIGKQVAKDLGIAFYDNEILQMAIDKTGYEEGYLKEYEEKAPNGLSDKMFSKLSFYQPLPYSKIQSEESKLIKGIAAKESCVIVGRAANFILRDVDHVSVFLFAPLEERIKRLQKLQEIYHQSNMTYAELKAAVNKVDTNRKQFHEYYTNQQWGSRDAYDLLINTSHAGIDGTIEIIKTYVEKYDSSSILPHQELEQ